MSSLRCSQVAVGFTFSHWAETQRTPDLRFYATLGEEPKVVVALV